MTDSMDASDAPSMNNGREASIATKQHAGHEQHQQQEVAMDLLLHAAAQQGHRVPAGALQQQKLLASLSHLHLNGLQLTQLHSLRMCPKLQVLYVYDNLLSNISSIAGNRLLAHLYCHNNLLTSLQGIQHLPLLQKLYAQGNCLTSLEGLSHTQHLQELHVSDQRPWAAAAGQHQLQHLHQQSQHQGAMLLPHGNQLLSGQLDAGSESLQQQQQQPALKEPQQDQLLLINDGALMQHVFTSTPPTPLHDAVAPDAAAMAEDLCSAAVGAAPAAELSSSSSPSCQSNVLSAGLCLEPASLAAMKGSLRVLAAANCGITDPRPLAVLTRLQVLDLAGNAIASLAVLQPMLEALGQLQDLDLSRNPCVDSSGSRYRDSIILAASYSLQLLDGEEVKLFVQCLQTSGVP